MGRTAQEFNTATFSEHMRFDQMVGLAIEATGMTAIEISDAFHEFRARSGARGPLVQDFVEFMLVNDINAPLAMAA